MGLPFSCLACALVLGSAAAQTTTVPASYTNSPAPSSTAYPYGYSGPIRVQILYAASETGLSGPALLRGLELRANPVSTNAAKSGIDLQVSLSASPFTRSTMTNTFATNHGPNETVVFNRKQMSAQATQPSFLGEGSGMILFDTPFVYSPASGSLLVDFDVASQPSGAWSIQSAAASPTSGRHSNIGAACQGLNLSSTGGGNGYSVTWSLSGGPPNTPGVFLLGLNQLPVPVPIPGSPGCHLYQDMLLSFMVSLNAAGGLSLPVGYAPNPALRGVTVYAQIAVVNVTANRVDTTQSRATTLTDAHDGGRVHSLGSNTSPTGFLQLGSMIVIRFQS